MNSISVPPLKSGRSSMNVPLASSELIINGQQELLEEIQSSITCDLDPQDFEQQVKSALFNLIKELPKEQQELFKKVYISDGYRYNNWYGKIPSEFSSSEIYLRENHIATLASDPDRILFIEWDAWLLRKKSSTKEKLSENPCVNYFYANNNYPDSFAKEICEKVLKYHNGIKAEKSFSAVVNSEKIQTAKTLCLEIAELNEKIANYRSTMNANWKETDTQNLNKLLSERTALQQQLDVLQIFTPIDKIADLEWIPIRSIVLQIGDIERTWKNVEAGVEEGHLFIRANTWQTEVIYQKYTDSEWYYFQVKKPYWWYFDKGKLDIKKYCILEYGQPHPKWRTTYPNSNELKEWFIE